MNSTGKKILSISVGTILLLPLSGSKPRKMSERVYYNFVINKGSIKYSGGTIYIGPKWKLDKIDKEEGDILVIDFRRDNDPDLRVIDSYKIYNADTREEIIDALLAYEEKYPTKWERTRASLIREWFAHNVMHFFNYKLDSTTDVDFNNADEYQYRLRKN